MDPTRISGVAQVNRSERLPQGLREFWKFGMPFVANTWNPVMQWQLQTLKTCWHHVESGNTATQKKKRKKVELVTSRGKTKHFELFAMATLDSIVETSPKDAPGAKRFMSKLMNTSVRAHIEDGRIIGGQLWCFDQLKNLILLSGYETRIEDGKSVHRALGPLILVPGKYILKLEATKNATEAALAESEEAWPKTSEEKGRDPKIGERTVQKTLFLSWKSRHGFPFVKIWRLDHWSPDSKTLWKKAGSLSLAWNDVCRQTNTSIH